MGVEEADNAKGRSHPGEYGEREDRRDQQPSSSRAGPSILVQAVSEKRMF
jgi:hypothetical protein